MKKMKNTEINDLINQIIDGLSPIDMHFSEKGHTNYQDQYFTFKLQDILGDVKAMGRELEIRKANKTT